MNDTGEASHPFAALEFARLSTEQSDVRAREFYNELNRRRTTRHFATDPVPREWIELAIRSAGTAPSGAHQQPWTFVAVSDPEIKRKIRDAAENEERLNYSGRMTPEWLDALAPLGTDENKPHLTDAPWLIIVMRQSYGLGPEGQRHTFYYTQESCGIAVGLFLAAVHHMGLVALTHTPSPMGFLSEVLQRPGNEKPFLVIPVGYPAPDARVPDLRRKSLQEISVWI